MVAISQALYDGTYTMTSKPIKSKELHYTMIQFLINENIPCLPLCLLSFDVILVVTNHLI